MGIFGLETQEAPSGLRRKRFLAFLLDIAIVFVLVFMAYQITGEPDFFRVKEAMDAAEAAGGTDAELTGKVFASFNRAYGKFLLIWFFYEVIVQLVLQGTTLGKRMMGLWIQPRNPERGKGMQMIMLCIRSGLKMLSLYFFQGFPFLICNLTLFTNGECCSGFDLAVKTQVVSRENK